MRFYAPSRRHQIFSILSEKARWRCELPHFQQTILLSQNLQPELRLEMVADFHERRIREMSQYEQCIDGIVIDYGDNPRKIDLSYRRLLKQPLAYQILTLIWISSPFSAGQSDWSKWECRDTVYNLASRLSQQKDDMQKLINYITRVIEAAEHYSLVTREAGDNNKRLIMGQNRLHTLMSEFALKCMISDQSKGA